MLRPLFFAALFFLLFIYWRQPSASTSSAPVPKSKTERVIQHQAVRHSGASPDLSAASKSGRTVAVGDLHSDLDQTLAVLRLANVVDKDQNWSGGQDTLVQTVMSL